MLAEYPVSREPIPWNRMLFTTAWGNWRRHAPAHAISLAVDGHVASSGFIAFASLSTTESVPLADIALAQFDGLWRERKETMVGTAGWVQHPTFQPSNIQPFNLRTFRESRVAG